MTLEASNLQSIGIYISGTDRKSIDLSANDAHRPQSSSSVLWKIDLATTLIEKTTV